jgi:quinol monooxygenase YgiN
MARAALTKDHGVRGRAQMDLEVAVLNAKDGDAARLVAALNDGGSAALASSPGCRSVKALAGVESPGTVLLLVEWDSVAAHEAAKTSPGFKRFFEIVGPHFAGLESLRHYSAG